MPAARSKSPSDTPPLRGLLLRRYEQLYERALALAGEHGYGFVTPAMARLFIEVGKGPQSVSQLARHLAISRQSLHETVLAAAKLGLVELRDDASNRRIKTVHFTAAGKRMSQAALAADRRVERQVAARIGPASMKTLKKILALDW
jgi:DNA-binding MarR family transcriptional regulator